MTKMDIKDSCTLSISASATLHYSASAILKVNHWCFHGLRLEEAHVPCLEDRLSWWHMANK